MLIIQPDTCRGSMTLLRTLFTLLILVCLLCTAGCILPFAADNRTEGTPGPSSPQSVAKYKVTLAQPGDAAKMIIMDSDVYNLGEVVEFFITNKENHDLSCSNDPPSFSVKYQKGNGQWVTRMGSDDPAAGTATSLKPGASTAPYRFVTTGWAPGRYRIVSDCDVSREILIRSLPPVSTAGTPCPPAGNTSPWIRTDPVVDPYAGQKFTISGTTNLAAGEELRYSILSLNSTNGNISAAGLISSATLVSGGSCGINTWSVNVLIQAPGGYFIGISNGANTVSAIKRFEVLPAIHTIVSATLPANTTSSGIAAG
jgi:hypothetical protein